MELEDLPDEPRSALPYTAADLYGRLHSLRAERLSFAYDEDKMVLVDADFTVKKGEFVALAGFSGIGKTTLFKLMMGFYPPAGGTLTAQLEDGAIPLNADTRCLFAYVPQNNMLLSGTIRDNIAFCCDNVTDEAIWAAAEVADVAEAIRLQPHGLDTVLGEGAPAYPRVSSSAWRLPARCCPVRRSCCWTSAPPRWTRPPRSGCCSACAPCRIVPVCASPIALPRWTCATALYVWWTASLSKIK